MKLKRLILVIFLITLYYAYRANSISDWLYFIGVWISAVFTLPSLFDWLQKHSKELCKEVQVIASSEIDFKLDQNDFNFYVKPETEEFYRPKKVIAHLEDSAYKDIQEIIKRRELFIKFHNIELHEFLVELNSGIIDKLQKTFKINEWDEISQPPPIKYYTKKLSVVIGQQVCYRLEKQKQYLYINAIEKETKEIDGKVIATKYKLSIDYLLVVSDNESELQNISIMIKKCFDDAIDSNGFGILKEYLEEIKHDHNTFKNKMLDLIEDVKSGGFMKGHCDLRICQDFLRYI